MKKGITIMLALVMVLSLAACGGGSATTNTPAATEAPATPEDNHDKIPNEDMSTKQFDEENAITTTPEQLYEEIKLNPLRAKSNTYIISCHDIAIKDEYITNKNLRIYLPTEEIINLNTGDNVVFIGRITDIVEENEYYGGGKFTTTWIEFGEAAIYDATLQG